MKKNITDLSKWGKSPRLITGTQNLQMIPVFEWYFYPECAIKNGNAIKKM